VIEPEYFFLFKFGTKNFWTATPTVSNVTLVDSHIAECSDEFKGGKILMLGIPFHTANDITKSLFLRQMLTQKAIFDRLYRNQKHLGLILTSIKVISATLLVSSRIVRNLPVKSKPPSIYRLEKPKRPQTYLSQPNVTYIQSGLIHY